MTITTVEWLTAVERDRLIRCLEMMDSAYDGQASTAAREATNILRRKGLSWRSIIGWGWLPPSPPSELPQAEPPRRRQEDDEDLFGDWPARWRWAVRKCLVAERLRAFDYKFLNQLDRYYKTEPSPAQLGLLRKIAERLLAMDPVA